MKENGVSGPSSLVYIHLKESYPKKELVFDDPSLSVPFPELDGEYVEFLGKCSDSVFAISNFRFFAAFQHSFVNVPLMLIESLEWKGKECPEIFICCKNGQSFQLMFDNAEEGDKWYNRLRKKCGTDTNCLKKLFAFAHYAWCEDTPPDSPCNDGDLTCLPSRDTLNRDFLHEYKRMGFEKDPAWKITEINSKFKLCSSYPKLHIVPGNITDEKLENIAKFRSSNRFPSAVWRHSENGSVIVRCSQPEVGMLYWRCADDEYYLKTLGSVPDSAASKPVQNGKNDSLSDTSCSSNDDDSDTSHTNGYSDNLNKKSSCNGVDKKVLVVDCRSYAAAFGNRVKGGGSECTEYYPNCKIQFMGLANIHTIRKSFQSLRDICCKQEEQTGWLAALEATKWLSHISALIKTALLVVKAIEQEKQHVVVHCSDGWDRTPQVVALAELLLDPYYRTIKGFRVLLEREWLAFGHKFADRCGHGFHDDDVNERCPVFLQFLDCVHQLLRQFPCSFEFNETFLVKLAHHTYSCLYGTFLCNTEQERLTANIRYSTCSAWSMLESQSRNCRNFLYSPQEKKVLYPEYQVRNIMLWSSLYCSNPVIFFDNPTSLNSSDVALNNDQEFHYDDVRTEPEIRPNVARRNSDGDVKVSSADGSLVAGSSARDDTELYLTKSLVCKSESMVSPGSSQGISTASPAKGSLANGVAEKSIETNTSCGNNDHDGALEPCTEEGCDNSSVDQNIAVFKSDNIALHQDGTKDKLNSSESDQKGLSEKNDLGDSLTSSSNTLVDESTSNNDEHMVNGSENGNDCLLNGLETSHNTKKTVSKAINCKSNHRLKPFIDGPLLSQDGASSSNIRKHFSEDGGSFNGCRGTPLSPKERSYNKLCKYIDEDGLSLVVDPVQARLVKLERCYRERIEGLETQLEASGCVCGLRQKVNNKQDMHSIIEPTYARSNSLSSNTASDTCGSWERVDDADVTHVLWVPDHLAVSCRGCDETFTITNRKHHCRNCGKVFCNSCCNDMSPVPSEQLYDPVRVCKPCFGKLHVKNNQDITVAAS
ncbi:myotubularin-related protein 3-like [Dendronephthya gigantea]|uniref:myotubularin-related protein 3-like n=1 Tax=Dendronephthya gigantea TaxID=151771 RepID=UPI00106CC4F3|nr:myotubularin-related protein 3-like [Dendronephthya gigantea]XP_028415230.1 myotubularin-related protein 3-like [Dendronephthya gigantea]